LEFQILRLTVTHRGGGGVLSKICVSTGLVTQMGGGGSSAINVKSHTNPIKFSHQEACTLHELVTGQARVHLALARAVARRQLGAGGTMNDNKKKKKKKNTPPPYRPRITSWDIASYLAIL
jgi:hypothetical protein